ncbi:hypothetical protein [Heyndrickxia ginsengihumi]|uniref:hypothetical protein n=1 Tax=Heyndrickxia ginsengihumi TaxID=363870 RepID=UPI003D1F1BF1
MDKFWRQASEQNSAYIHWIDQLEAKYPDVQKISTNEFGRIRESFANLLEEKRKVAAEYLVHELKNEVKTESQRKS